jgi:hypothetical protein
VMGSSYITNLAFNVIVVWRNRAKQDKLEEIFQTCTDIWSLEYPDRPMPQWKRLLGGHPDKNVPQAIKENWNTLISMLEKLPPDKQEDFQQLVMQHDAYFIVDAQRGGDGDCPARHLWFHYDSLQFLEVSPWKDDKKRNTPTNYAAKGIVEMDEEI